VDESSTRLRKRIDELGYSVREVAEACGVSYVRMYELARGCGLPNVVTGVRIARFLEVDVADLFEGRREHGANG